MFNDAPGGFSEELKEFTYSAGAEYLYQDSFAMRLGYFHESPMKGARKFFSLGAGFKYNVVKIDVSYLFSASKVVTAMLVHKLAEDHLIDLLAPVAHYLPEFGVNGKQHITAAHILSHRAGLPTIQGDFETDLLFDTPAVVKVLFDAKPQSRSGHKAAYHAVTGGYILGELIQRVSGMDARQYLQQLITTPLGMKHFNYGLAPEHRGTEAVGYATGLKSVLAVDWFLQNALGGDLDTVVNLTNDPRFMDVICPAGNIFATADEACRFFELLLRGGELDGEGGTCFHQQLQSAFWIIEGLAHHIG